MPNPIHTRATYHTDKRDPNGPALFRLEFWPVPQDVGSAILLEAEALVKQRLREAGWSGQEVNLTAKGPMQ